MKQRVKEKLMTNVAAKILARLVEPTIDVKVTKPEKRIYKKNKSFITYLVIEARKDYFK